MNMRFNLRQQMEAEIERLLAILDAMDGDPDLEPSLGSYDPQICACDCEDQCDDEGDLGDSGIADADGLVEQLSGIRNVGGIGSTGLATHAE